MTYIYKSPAYHIPPLPHPTPCSAMVNQTNIGSTANFPIWSAHIAHTMPQISVNIQPVFKKN